MIIRQKKYNKLSKNYESDPYSVVKLCGPSVVVKSGHGKFYRRHISHVKKYNGKAKMSVNKDQCDYDYDFLTVTENGNLNHVPNSNPNGVVHRQRPERIRRRPRGLDDYYVY